MALQSAPLLQVLRSQQLLTPEQLAALPPVADDTTLLRDLVGRGWLTSFQAGRLAAGDEASLNLGNYVLLDLLGEGGMGAVFKARHRKLDRVVAVKRIKGDRLGSADAVRRFQREIQAAAALSHPNIVHAHDADEAGPHRFLVLEYVEGVDLRRRLERGRLGAAEAIDYLRQVARGLEYAREKGIVHRDIKPQNLLLSTNGVVKILDLGLARLLESADGQESVTQLTGEGALLGTPDYIAPEQALDTHAADHRSDLYSLGCTFYHLLAGRVPFPGGKFIQKIDAHRFVEPEPLAKLRPDLPAPLLAVVARLMRKRPEERFGTAAELIAALGTPTFSASPPAPGPANPFDFTADTDATAPRTVGDPPPVARPRRWRWAIPLAGAVLGAAALVAWLARPTPAPRPIEEDESPEFREYAALVERVERAGRSAPESEATERLRQDLIAYSTANAGGRFGARARFRLTQLPSPLDRLNRQDHVAAEQRPTDLPKAVVAVLGDARGRTSHPVFGIDPHPDGKRMVSWGKDQCLRVWGVPEMTLDWRYRLGELTCALFSGDGKRILVGTNNSRILAWTYDGRTTGTAAPVAVATNDPANVITSLASHGTDLYAGDSNGVVHRLDAREWPPAPVASEARDEGAIRQLLISPDGKTLVSVGMYRSLVYWDVSGRALKVRQAEPKSAAKILALAFSADGKRLATGDAGKLLIVRDRQPGGEYTPGPPFRSGRNLHSLCFAADGREVWVGSDAVIACVRHGDKGWQFVSESNGPQGDVIGIRTPDGGRTFYVGAYDGSVRAYLRQGDKLVERRPLTGHLGQVSSLAFSPDGRRLVTGGWYYGSTRLWDLTARPIRDEVVVAASNRSPHADFSPDGRFFTSTNVGLQLFTTADRKRWLPEWKHDLALDTVAFSPDAKHLLTASEDGIMRLWDVATGRVAAEHAFGRVRALAFSPDGRWFVAAGGGFADTVPPRVRVFDTATLKEQRRSDGHPNLISSVAVHPDERRVFTVCQSGWLLSRHHDSDEVLTQVKTGLPTVAMAMMPGGQHLWLLGNRQLLEWDLDAAAPRRRIDLPETAHGLAISSDGRHLAVGLDTGIVYILRP